MFSCRYAHPVACQNYYRVPVCIYRNIFGFDSQRSAFVKPLLVLGIWWTLKVSFVVFLLTRPIPATCSFCHKKVLRCTFYPKSVVESNDALGRFSLNKRILIYTNFPHKPVIPAEWTKLGTTPLFPESHVAFWKCALPLQIRNCEQVFGFGVDFPPLPPPHFKVLM